jgi:nucleotidyltransferase substrate binding protein (TIGR01987 family)
MNDAHLDITGLKNAISSLERALNVVMRKEQEEGVDPDEIETLHAGLIQNFEFTYELCWKNMKRWLEFNVSREITLGITRNELFRLAAENTLVADIEAWMDFHRARNSTSHEYGGAIAESVYKKAREFLPHAKDFVLRMERMV